MHPSTNAGKFGKQWHVVLCSLPLVVPLLFGLGLIGRGPWLLLTALFVLVLAPLLDLLTGWQDNVEFEKSDFSRVQLFFLHWNARLYAVLHIGCVIYGMILLPRLSLAEIAALVSAASLTGGIGFAAAHELLHAKERIDQLLQRILTAFLFYPHYKLIHIRSHHVHAGTDHDENTAWFDESVYAYIFRTIPGSMIRCWQMEARHPAGNTSSLGARLKNKMYFYMLGQVALLVILYLIGGWQGLLFYMAQTVGAHLVLESVNYIQHYGLLRKKQDGEYEKTGPEHSWDTYHLFSSYATFRVGHHSYHHIAVKPYYLLAAEPDAPKLPVGYFWAIAMVFLPPWWRRVINPKLQESPVPAQAFARFS